MKKTEEINDMEMMRSGGVFKMHKASARYEGRNDVEVTVGTEIGEWKVKVRSLGSAAPNKRNKE